MRTQVSGENDVLQGRWTDKGQREGDLSETDPRFQTDVGDLPPTFPTAIAILIQDVWRYILLKSGGEKER